MKNFIYVVLLALLSTITGCSGSDVYRGAWKGMDRQGNKWEIVFEPSAFTVKNNKGISEKYEYTQNSISIKNSVKTYGITLKDGRVFMITFPIAGNTSKGIISLDTNEALYTIGRTEYVDYNDLLKL